jgi:hypothetical protein
MEHAQKELQVKRRIKYLGVLALLTFAFSLCTVYAQTSINTTGGSVSGSGGSVSYSVGQVVYTTNTETSGSVAQGVQHAYEIFEITEDPVPFHEIRKGINLSVVAYPNPTTDYLQLTVASENMKELSYQLYDMKGTLLQNEKITGNQARIVMSHFVPANYVVRVVQGSKDVKTFKVIKY